MAELNEVAQTILRLAQRQGYVVQRDVRSELRLVGLPETEWKAVIASIGDEFNYKRGRYYHRSTIVGPRLKHELDQLTSVGKSIRALMKSYRKTRKMDERRGDRRIDFVRTLRVIDDHDKEITMVSRDLSPRGIRLMGTHRLLGQKVRVELPREEQAEALKLNTRILWTFAIGDGLYENGGAFTELAEDS